MIPFRGKPDLNFDKIVFIVLRHFIVSLKLNLSNNLS